jgi:hypothetical protein
MPEVIFIKLGVYIRFVGRAVLYAVRSVSKGRRYIVFPVRYELNLYLLWKKRNVTLTLITCNNM